MGEKCNYNKTSAILLKIFNIKYIFALCIGFSVTFAQWSDDPGNPQMLGSGIQPQVQATSDGGVYIAWLTDMGGYHVYLQRFDAMGVAQFESGGMLISDNNNASWIAVYHLNLMVDKNKLAYVDLVAENFSRMVDEAAGRLKVEVASAAPLDESLVAGLRDEFSKLTGKQVELEVEVDESLLGGVVARYGGMVYDGSIKTQLKQMGEALCA